MSGFNKLTSSQILRIYRAVEQTPLLEDFANEGTFADFVASIWDIHNMPSEDDRYKTNRVFSLTFRKTASRTPDFT